MFGQEDKALAMRFFFSRRVTRMKDGRWAVGEQHSFAFSVPGILLCPPGYPRYTPHTTEHFSKWPLTAVLQYCSTAATHNSHNHNFTPH